MGQTPSLMASSLCLRPENILLVVSEVNPGRPQSPHDYCPIILVEVLEPWFLTYSYLIVEDPSIDRRYDCAEYRRFLGNVVLRSTPNRNSEFQLLTYDRRGWSKVHAVAFSYL